MRSGLAADIFTRAVAPEGSGVAQVGDNRRRHPRFHCGGEAEVRSLASGARASGKIANLSVGGCLIQLRDCDCFRKGEAVEMTFCVRQLPVRVQGAVRQIHPSEAIGLEFTLLSERGRRQLTELIGELAEVLRDQVGSMTNPKR